MEKRDHAASAYYQLILDPDPTVHMPAARQWCLYEAQCATLLPELAMSSTMNDQQCYIVARIQAHYFQHSFFRNEIPLLKYIDRIKKIPTEIVQGRYDMICPLASADYLQQAWPEAHMQIIANAGHSSTEPGIRRALRNASEKFKVLNYKNAIKESEYEYETST